MHGLCAFPKPNQARGKQKPYIVAEGAYIYPAWVVRILKTFAYSLALEFAPLEPIPSMQQQNSSQCSNRNSDHSGSDDRRISEHLAAAGIYREYPRRCTAERLHLSRLRAYAASPAQYYSTVTSPILPSTATSHEEAMSQYGLPLNCGSEDFMWKDSM